MIESDSTTGDDVVIPLRPDQARSKDPTGAERQARWRNNRRNGGAKKHRKIKTKRTTGMLTVTPDSALAVTPPIAPTVTQKIGADVTHYPRETSTQRAPLAPSADVHVPAERHGRGIRFAALTAALALATVPAHFSITGMT